MPTTARCDGDRRFRPTMSSRCVRLPTTTTMPRLYGLSQRLITPHIIILTHLRDTCFTGLVVHWSARAGHKKAGRSKSMATCRCLRSRRARRRRNQSTAAPHTKASVFGSNGSGSARKVSVCHRSEDGDRSLCRGCQGPVEKAVPAGEKNMVINKVAVAQ